MPTLHRVAGLFVAIALCACGSLPPGITKAKRQLAHGDYEGAEKTAAFELNRYPKHPTLWRVRIQAAMGDRDNVRAAKLYQQWHGLRDKRHDRRALRLMAMTMMWQGLRVPSVTVRTRTIQAVERLELEDLADDVSRLITHDDDRVAVAAAVAMLKADPSAGRVVAQGLRSSDMKARIIAINGIGRKVGAKARADIVAMLKDSKAAVRMAAVRVIGGFSSNEDTAQLVTVAAGDSDGAVRATALRILRKGKRSGLLKAARTALTDKYLGARLAGVELLGHLDATSRLTALIANSDLFVALRAMTMLKQTNGTLIARALTDSAWQIRVAAIGALHSSAFTKTNRAGYAVALLADKRVEVRIAASRALLHSSHHKRAIAALAKELGNADDNVKLQAARNLISAKDARGVHALVTLLSSASMATRSAAIGTHVAAKTITLGLVRALADESAQLRIAAAEALLTI